MFFSISQCQMSWNSDNQWGRHLFLTYFSYIIPHTFLSWIKSKYNRCRNSFVFLESILSSRLS